MGDSATKTIQQPPPPPSPPAGEPAQAQSTEETELPPPPKKAKTDAGPSHSPVRDEDDHNSPTASPHSSVFQHIQQAIVTARTPTDGEFIPLSQSNDSPPPVSHATTRSRSGSPAQESARPEQIETPVRSIIKQTYPQAPWYGYAKASQRTESSPERVTYGQYEDEGSEENKPCIGLNEQDLYRLLFRLLSPDAFQNIMAAILADAQADIETLARLPLQKTAVLIDVLINFNSNYTLGTAIENSYLPIRALALVINKIQNETDDASLREITDNIQTNFDTTATLIANMSDSSTDPLSEHDLKEAVKSLEKVLLRSKESEPCKLPLTEESIDQINEQVVWNQTVFDELMSLTDDEEFKHFDLQRLTEKAKEDNIIYVVNEDDSICEQIGKPGQLVTDTPSLISDYKEKGLTHFKVTILPPSLTSPALKLFLENMVDQMNSPGPLWVNLAQYILEGIHTSIPFAMKNKETLQILAQVLPLLASVSPPVIPDSGLNISHGSTDSGLATTLQRGSEITLSLLGGDNLPQNYALEGQEEEGEGDEEGDKKVEEENTKVTLTLSNQTLNDQLIKLEKEIMQERYFWIRDYFESKLFCYQDQDEENEREEDEYGNQPSPPSGHAEDLSEDSSEDSQRSEHKPPNSSGSQSED